MWKKLWKGLNNQFKRLPVIRNLFKVENDSPFRTTDRNRIRYACIGLLQLGAFAVFLSVMTYDLPGVFCVAPFLITVVIWLLFLRTSPSYWNMGWKGRVSQLTIIGFLLILMIWLEPSLLRRVLAILSLPLMLLARGPRLFISRQRMHYRELMRGFRQDHIRSNISPFLTPVNFINRLLGLLDYFTSQISATVKLLLIFLFFGFVSLIIERRINDEPNSVLFYLSLGLASGFFASLIAFVFWVVMTRQKHLVLPFKIVNADSKELQSMAYLMTHMFVDELQRIRKLLQIRQVEMADIGRDSGLALFVTSGREQELIEEFETLGEIRLSSGLNVSIPFAGILSILAARLARSTVRGHIQKRSDNSIDIWAEISIRGGNTQSIGLVKVLPIGSDRIGEQTMREKASELAGKLMLKTGNITHIANSWDSFQYFLAGLEASHEGNWWYAISNYRRAIHIEEAEQNTFGLGHYHLGAALLFQGDYFLGLEHLRIARASGPLMAETHYMVALAKLYMDANNLDNPHLFARIDKILETACNLKPSFPEAYHLWGMIYYIRARLIEEHRQVGSSFTFNKALPYYRRATKHLFQALNQYWSDYRKLLQQKSDSSQSSDAELRRLMIDITATTHKLGDALRGQQLYSEADSFYDDVIEVHPENIRTLIDRGKTYCLAQNWQRAFYYLSKRIMQEHQTDLQSESYFFWQPEANLYMAWTKVGGVVGERKIEFNTAKHLFFEAIAELDYALTMQPSFTRPWRETNWLPQFLVTAFILSGDRTDLERYQSGFSPLFRLIQWGWYQIQSRWSWTNSNREPIINSLLPNIPRTLSNNEEQLIMEVGEAASMENSSSDDLEDSSSKKNKLATWVAKVSGAEELQTPLGQLRWLAWRVDSFSFINKNAQENCPQAITDENLASCLRGKFQDSLYEEAHRELKEGRKKVDELLKLMEEGQRSTGLDFDYARLEIAEDLRRMWVIIGECPISLPHETETEIRVQIKDRLVIDLYLELALLRIRMLVEGGAYEVADKTATTTLIKLENWLLPFKQWWQKRAESGDSFREIPHWFSPKILVFQQATIQAWLAFAKFNCYQDEATKQRVQNSPYTNQFKGWLDLSSSNEILDLAKKSFDQCRYQPLARYTEALVLSWQEFQGHAVDRLLLILDTINAFDPHTYIPNLSRRYRPRQSGTLLYTESISGLKQFDGIMDRSIIHSTIAAISSRQSKPVYALRHYQAAVAWSPYIDRDANNFMRMAQLLDEMGRMEESLAATQEAKRRLRIIQNKVRSVTWRTPRLYESFLYAKMEFRVKSLELINRIKDIPPIEQLDEWADQKEGNLQNYIKCTIELIKIYINLNLEIPGSTSQWLILAKSPPTYAQLRTSVFPELLKKYRACQKIKLNSLVKEVIMTKVLAEVAKEAKEVLIQYSKVTNNIAYNHAQLHTNLNYALEQSLESIRIIREVLDLTEDLGSTPAKFNQPTEPNKSLLNLSEEDRARVAIKLDTCGWVLFRQNELDLAQQSLEIACHLLPEDPDLQYHLARVYMAQCEALWQLSGSKELHLKEIRYFLQQSRRQWQYARRYDVKERLYPRLIRLQESLSDYTENWQSFHTHSKSSESETKAAD